MIMNAVRCQHDRENSQPGILAQVVVPSSSWSTRIERFISIGVRPFCYPLLALFALKYLLQFANIGPQMLHAWASVFVLGLAGIGALAYVAQTLFHSVRWKHARTRFTNSTPTRVTWIGDAFGSDDAIDAVRSVVFRPIVLPYSRVRGQLSDWQMIGLCSLLALIAAWGGSLSGVPGLTGPLAVLCLAACLLWIGGFLFPWRIRVAPGVLQIVRASRLSMTATVWKEVPLKEARVVLWALSPAMIELAWPTANGTERFVTRIESIELCNYVCIGAITTVESVTLPAPTPGEALTFPGMKLSRT